MKIEMGESLFYSWLRHAKECPLVQTNWKPSPSWELNNADEIEDMMAYADEHFKSKYSYEIFKNSKLAQLLIQAEIDVLGISLLENDNMVYAVDVAYHENGLNYGDKQETTMRVAKKILRTALCIHGYFVAARAEIVFASPKINPSNLAEITPTIVDINDLFKSRGWEYTARIIANDDFNELVMKPIMLASADVSDTSELFLRSYQLVKMFGMETQTRRSPSVRQQVPSANQGGALGELKIGKIAQSLLRDVLVSGSVSDEEIEWMQTKDYSKQVFGLDFPLLVSADNERNGVRYYANPLKIKGNIYYLCSQWFEVSTNNDRPLLMKWLKEKSAVYNGLS